jgi:hypothetical protein
VQQSRSLEPCGCGAVIGQHMIREVYASANYTRPIPKVSTNRRLWLCAMLVMSSRKVEWYPDADRCSCIRQLLRRFGRSSFGSSRQPTRFMKHNEFHVGLEFWCGGNRWRCTDVGSRTVVAISLEPHEVVKIERVGSRTEEVRERRLMTKETLIYHRN